MKMTRLGKEKLIGLIGAQQSHISAGVPPGSLQPCQKTTV